MTALLILLFLFCHAGIGAVLLAAVEARRRWREANSVSTAGPRHYNVANGSTRHQVDNLVSMGSRRAEVERPRAPRANRMALTHG